MQVTTAVLTVVITMVGLMFNAQEGRRSAPDVTYSNFIRLDPEQRDERFRLLSPENKAMLKRTHARSWLVRNRSQLTTAQIAAVHLLRTSATANVDGCDR